MKRKYTFPTVVSMVVLAFAFHTGAIAQPLQEYSGQCILQAENEFRVDLEDGAVSVAECIASRLISQGDDALVAALNQHGKAHFGAGFSVTSDLRWGLLGNNKVLGDVDLVMPLAGSKGSGSIGGKAFFMQSGTTMYRDEQGDKRHDMRLGVAYRTAVGKERNDIWGVSLLSQENSEYGHRRLVLSADYAGQWGTASLNFFEPDTGWRAVRAGYEERTLAGREVNVRLNLTNTLDMQMAFARWEQEDAPHVEKNEGRLGLQWQPHPYLSLSGSRSGIGTDTPENTWRVAVKIPLGPGKPRTPRWQGFGVMGAARASSADLWRRVDNIDRIEVGERKRQFRPGEVITDAQVRFLQDSTATGSEFGIEVILSEAALANTTVVVHLRPGTGAHPAVAGVDYAEEPIEVNIRAGRKSGTAVARLLVNPDITVTRTISAVVTAV